MIVFIEMSFRKLNNTRKRIQNMNWYLKLCESQFLRALCVRKTTITLQKRATKQFVIQTFVIIYSHLSTRDSHSILINPEFIRTLFFPKY